MKEKIKLTSYSSGAGCGCKIAPNVLSQILKTKTKENHKNLLVGNATKDDAAVYKIDKENAIISTTDFFMPIADDAKTFGMIAATNAISDVYAMGGTPIMALAILGWPLSKLPASLAREVIGGAREVCAKAGIALAGGHSIDSAEPIFGLSVNGSVKIKNLKRNDTAKNEDILFLTKPIGVGTLATAEKAQVLRSKDRNVAKNIMLKLNQIGQKIGGLSYVNAMTDVTGFGLLGHLIEMCEGSSLKAEVLTDNVVIPKCLDYYLDMECVAGGTIRNMQSYGAKIHNLTDRFMTLFCDPQTSGGLLISVSKKNEKDFVKFLVKNGFENHTKPIGRMTKDNGTKNIVSLI